MNDYLPFETNLRDRRRNKYAVVTFLPRTLGEAVAPLREKFDPDYSLVAPHITIVYPFETNRPLDDLTSRIGSETKSQQSIQIQLDSIGDFYPKSPVIYWNVTDNPKLSELYFRLYATLGIPIPFKYFVPHVTVAKEISPHRLVIVKEQIASYLARETFYAASVDLLTPLVDGRWVSVRSFPLKGLSENPLMMP